MPQRSAEATQERTGETARTQGFSVLLPADQASRTWVLTCGLLFASWFALAWPWLSGTYVIPWDGAAHFHAQAVFLAQSIHSGESPFWAPYVFGGHPQIADPQSLIFAPGFLLLAWLTPNPTFAQVATVTYGTLLFGALGIIGFGRDRRWHPAAALVAAIAFAFGSGAAWRNQHIGQLMSLAYFPWALWMLERSLRLNSRRYGALAGLFAGLTVLGPDQVAYLVMVILAAFVILFWLTGQDPIRRVRRSVRPLFAGAVVGALITAIPMLMVLNFAGLSNRAHIELDDAHLGSLHPSSLLTFVIGNLFGTIGPGEQYWGAPSAHWPYIVLSYIARNMANFYMGALPVIGIIIWITSREAFSRRMIAIAIAFLLMIAYALGRYTPFFAFAYHVLPGSDLFRRPADSLFLVGATGAILAGFGLNEILRRPYWRPGWALILFLLLVFATGTAMAIWLMAIERATSDILIALATVSVSITVLAFAVRHARARPVGIAILLGLCVTADIGWNIRPNHSTALPPENFSFLRPGIPNETIDFLRSRVVANATRRDRVELTGLGFEWPNATLIHRFEHVLGYNPLRMGAYGRAVGARDHVAGWDQRRFSPLMPGYRSPIANLVGLRFLATWVPAEKIDPSFANNPWSLVARTKEAYIYENPDTLPRVMVVPRAQVLDQDELLRSGLWPSTDFRQTVFIEPTPQPLPGEGAGGTAGIQRYGHTHVRIAVEAARGGVLLLNDAWHPWWFARVDGVEKPILRANGAFRAVILPPGARSVEFEFRPMRGLLRDWQIKLSRVTSH